jgi:hypothetical protein
MDVGGQPHAPDRLDRPVAVGGVPLHGRWQIRDGQAAAVAGVELGLFAGCDVASPLAA